jgi:hypothetical protein
MANNSYIDPTKIMPNYYTFDPTKFNVAPPAPAPSSDPLSQNAPAPASPDLGSLAQQITNNPYQIDWSTFNANITKAVNTYLSSMPGTNLTNQLTAPQTQINQNALANAQGGLSGLVDLQKYLQSTPSFKEQEGNYNDYQNQINNANNANTANNNSVASQYQALEQQYANMNPKDISEAIGFGELQPFLSQYGGGGTGYQRGDAAKGKYQGVDVSMPTFGELGYNALENATGNSASQWILNTYTPQIEAPYSAATKSMNTFIDNTKSLYTNLGLNNDQIAQYMKPISDAITAYQNMYVNVLGTPTNPVLPANSQSSQNGGVTQWSGANDLSGYSGGGS